MEFIMKKLPIILLSCTIGIGMQVSVVCAADPTQTSGSSAQRWLETRRGLSAEKAAELDEL